MIPKCLRKIGFYIRPIQSIMTVLVGFAGIIAFVYMYNTGPDIGVGWYVVLILLEFWLLNDFVKHGKKNIKNLKRYKRHARRVKGAKEHGH